MQVEYSSILVVTLPSNYSSILRDEVDLHSFSSYVLVDHHVSNLDPQKIAMVFDHRPRDANAVFRPNCSVHMAEVGSCATLITNYILQESANSTDDEKGVLKLLYGEAHPYVELLIIIMQFPSLGPIILDTINFSPEADKARRLDVEVVAKMEGILDIHDPGYRKCLFDELVVARSDVSELDSYQILFKDMKVMGGKIAIPGYPIRVQEYIQMASADRNVHRFANELNCDVVVLMGLKFINGRVLRDLALVNIKNASLFASCQKSLEGSAEFQFQKVGLFLDGPVYEQLNIKLSRKQIMPILNKLL